MTTPYVTKDQIEERIRTASAEFLIARARLQDAEIEASRLREHAYRLDAAVATLRSLADSAASPVENPLPSDVTG